MAAHSALFVVGTVVPQKPRAYHNVRGSHRTGGTRAPDVLRHSSELSTTLAEVDLRLKACCSSDHHLSGRILGLLQIRKGTCYKGPLTLWLPCEQEQWHYYSKANDAYSVQVMEAVHVRAFIPAVRSRVSSRTNHSCLFKLAPECYQEVLDLAGVRGGGEPGTLGETLNQWGVGQAQILALELPMPLAFAAVHGRLASVLLLGRWQVSQRLFSHWPNEYFFAWSRSDELGIVPTVRTLDQCRNTSDNPQWVQAELQGIANHIRSWAPQLLQHDRGRLADLDHVVSFLDVLGEGFRTADLLEHTGRSRYEAIAIIHTVCASYALKRRDHLKNTVRTCISLVLPPVIKDSLLHCIDSGRFRLMSKTSLWRYAFRLDVAFARLNWDRFDATSSVFYLWADSSPQGGRNWLLAQFHSIRRLGMQELASDVDRLALGMFEIRDEDGSSSEDESLAHAGHIEADGGDIDWEELPPAKAKPITVASLTAVICKHIHVHNLMPAALGSGAESLPHKMRALLHMMHMECESEASLLSLCESVYGVTTDMGTEIGLAETVHDSLQQWFEATCQPRRQYGVELDDGSAVYHDGAAALGRHHVFSQALPWPGILHIIDNLTLQLFDKALEDWTWFEKGIGCLNDLLSKRWRRERFIATCLRSDPQGCQHLSLDTHEFPSIASWRAWGSLTQQLEKVMPLRGSLQRFWSAAKYNRQGAEEKEDTRNAALDTHLLTETIQDPYFWAYCSMLYHIQTLLEQLRKWSESCPCHSRILTQQLRDAHVDVNQVNASSHWRRMCKTEADLCQHRTCPMNGKRAPEVVCSVIQQTFDAVANASEMNISSVLAVSLPLNQRGKLLSEWSSARTHLRAVLEMKLHFASVIPWQLCGLAHHDRDLVQQCARNCLGQWDACPDARYHHRVSVTFLGPPSGLRPQIEAIAGGASMTDYPQLLSAIAPLKFIPIVERTIEQKHAFIKRAIQGSKHSPVTVSLANRMPEIERLFASEPSALLDLANHLDLLRSNKAISSEFGFAHHASVVACDGRPDWAADRAVMDYMYHCVPEDQHVLLQGPKRLQAVATCQQVKLRKGMEHQRTPLTFKEACL
jgi:hypothetical protein